MLEVTCNLIKGMSLSSLMLFVACEKLLKSEISSLVRICLGFVVFRVVICV